MNANHPHAISRRKPRPARFSRHAFTLIEIMVVVAIMGVILAAGAPSLYRLMHKEGFRKTVGDVVEVCSAARARAILQGATTTVVFHPQEGRCEIQGGGGSRRSGASQGLATSAQIGKDTIIEMLDVNLTEYKDAETVGVQFFSNGTCDEMTLILRSGKNEWRKISLEITTGLVSVESDPNKWR